MRRGYTKGVGKESCWLLLTTGAPPFSIASSAWGSHHGVSVGVGQESASEKGQSRRSHCVVKLVKATGSERDEVGKGSERRGEVFCFTLLYSPRYIVIMLHRTLSHIHSTILVFATVQTIDRSYFIFSHPYSSWIGCIAISILNTLSLKPNNYYIFHWNPRLDLAT